MSIRKALSVEIIETPRPVSLARDTLVLQTAAFWLMTRLLYVLGTYAALAFAEPSTFASAATWRKIITPHQLVTTWAHFDADFYVSIAQSAYAHTIDANFFPLYPLIIRLVLIFTGSQHAIAAALLVSNLATLLGFIGLAVLARDVLRREDLALGAVLLLAVSPFAFWLAAPYTEGLSLAFITWALLAIRRGWWLRASLLVSLASLTHVTGLTLAVPLLVEYGRQHVTWRRHSWLLAWWREIRTREDGRVRLAAVVLTTLTVLLAAPAGIGIYSAYCWQRWHDPLFWLHTQQTIFYHQLVWPWQAVGLIAENITSLPAGSYMQARVFADFLPLVAALVLLIINLRRLPVAFSLYVGTLVYFCMAAPVVGLPLSDTAISSGRYLLLAVPLLFPLMEWCERWPWLRSLLIGGSLIVQVILCVFYLRYGWLV